MGCAHEKNVDAWQETPATKRLHAEKKRSIDADVERSSRPARRQANEKQTNEDIRSCGMRIDDALGQFIAERVRIKYRAKKGSPDLDKDHSQNWTSVLARIDAALTIAPIGEDLGAFVRAHAALSFEYQVDKDRKRKLPKNLGERIGRTLGGVNVRVEELRTLKTPGMLAPRRRAEPGMLVLHRPVHPMTVTSPFGLRDDPLHGGKRFHAGIDVGARFGTMVYASAKGWAVYAGWQGGYGNHVIIDHGDGVRTHYSHMHQIYIKHGQVVEAKDTIGSVGATGRATGPHLHFAVTNALGQFLDPSDALRHPMDTRLSAQELEVAALRKAQRAQRRAVKEDKHRRQEQKNLAKIERAQLKLQKRLTRRVERKRRAAVQVQEKAAVKQANLQAKKERQLAKIERAKQRREKWKADREKRRERLLVEWQREHSHAKKTGEDKSERRRQTGEVDSSIETILDDADAP
ncbi:MAG: peptidoglycan DD-metalloendopeptidase family protein [Deltaproteobacteria bacterium]|nr:peptidoglycan DD-metalloendopeptidase family protein [Deltaproteobacteria bacterium]